MLYTVPKGIDNVIDWQGRITSFLVMPLVFVVVFEVFMRYVVNRPTIWAFEVTMFIYGLHYMFGLAYMDFYDGHVKVDVFVTRFLSTKSRLIVKIISFFIISLPVTLGIFWWCMKFGWTSTVTMEKNWTSWAPYIWPYKDLMALGFLFLLLQGISNLLKTFQELKTLGKGGDNQ